MSPSRLRGAFFILLLSVGVEVSAAGKTIPVTLTWADSDHSAGSARASLSFLPLGMGEKEAEALRRREPGSIPGSVEVELQSDSRYLVELAGNGLWAEAQVFDPTQGQPLTIEVRPGGRIHLPLTLPRGDAPISSMALVVKSVASSPGITPWEASSTCPVLKGAIDCALPAGRLDLRFRSESYAPVYLWDLAVRRGGSVRLDPIALLRGASLSGWVATHDRQPPGRRCHVELTPETAAIPEGPASDQRLRALRFTTQPNARGFFQLRGLPVGRYRVSASQSGLAPVSVGPIEVRAGLESQLSEPLILAPPIVFRISVEPPVDAFGARWTIRLARRALPSDAPKEQWSGRVDENGTWKTPALSPDTYEVEVVDEETSIWKSEFVEVAFGEPDLPIQVELVEIAVQARLGKEALQAEIRLSRKGRALKFHSDEKGRFSGFLPEAGTWGVEIRDAAEGLSLALDEPLEIRVPKGKRRANVEITVPDTRIAGEVVDDEGKPIPGAQVTALRNDSKARTSRLTTDKSGQFLFRGLPAGDVSLMAEEGGRESEVQSLLVSEGEKSSEINLVLRRTRLISGQVVGPSGGVPGAGIFAFSTLTGLGSGAGQQEVAGPDGRFEIRLVGSSPSISLVVMAPGFAFHMETAPVPESGGIEVRLEAPGGELTLDIESASPAPVLVKDGTFIPLQLLELWGRINGAPRRTASRVTIPQMEAGAYSLCRGAAAISSLRQGQVPGTSSCVSGVLAPHGELTLSSPRAAG